MRDSSYQHKGIRDGFCRMNDSSLGQENGRFRPMHPHPEGAKGDAKAQVVVPVIGGVVDFGTDAGARLGQATATRHC
jgi:hypothetical protein